MAATFLHWVGIERRGATVRTEAVIKQQGDPQEPFPITEATRIERAHPPAGRAPRAPDLIMTVNEVAAYFRVHPSTIYRMLKYKKIPAFKLGDCWRFNQSELDRWRLNRNGKRK